MRKTLAWVWLAVVLTAGLHVGIVLWRGLPLETGLMALLPAEEQDVDLQAAKTQMMTDLSQRVLVLVGHTDRAQARAAASRLFQDLKSAGVLTDAGDIPAAEALRRLGEAYFHHRHGLLSPADRQHLAEGQGTLLVRRALSQIYGVGGISNGKLLAEDPFLLLPSVLADLPVPASRLRWDDGWPTVSDSGTTWVLVSGKLTGNAYALSDQERFVTAYDSAVRAIPGVTALRLGTVFYAEAGARTAMDETSIIGTVSLVGASLLILVVFRSGGPLALSLLVLGGSMLVALSVCLLVFERIHAAALTFGSGLIGIAVDYSLHYFCQVFSGAASPKERLQHVMTGVVLGLLTTLVGYGALALSPLPGLRQVAVFSAAGLVGAFASVVLWLPPLDRAPARPLPSALRLFATGLWLFWEQPQWRGLRWGIGGILLAGAGWGLLHFTISDDVRRQQALDPTLATEQAQVQRLIGVEGSGQFFLVRAADTETALQQEERLGERLTALQAKGALGGWRSPARFVPSLQRQEENQRLVTTQLLEPHLVRFRAGIGMREAVGGGQANPSSPLTLADVTATQALPLLSGLILSEGRHMVALDTPRDLAALAAAAEGLEGVRFVDPTADLTDLLGLYRQRTLWLIGVSALLMTPVLLWRYGWKGAGMVLVPPGVAVLLTPLLLAAVGLPFSFFAAMALILVLSIGIDYALFCAEADGSRDPITVLATWLATLTTVLSFGLLAFSSVPAVRSFGAVMLVGILLAAGVAPVAGWVRPKR